MKEIAEMSEAKATFFILSLVKNIAGSFDAKSAEDAETRQLMHALITKQTPEDLATLTDPVVEEFLNHISCFNVTLNTITLDFKRVSKGTIGEAWAKARGGFTCDDGLLRALQQNPSVELARFVSILCRDDLQTIVDYTLRKFNFLEGKPGKDIYSINMNVNCFTTYSKEYEMFFSADDYLADSFLTNDINNIVDGAPHAIVHELNELSKIAFDECYSFRDTHVFNGASIYKNGVHIFNIPMLSPGYEKSDDPNKYLLDFRSKLNANPEENYKLDLEGIEVLNASGADILAMSRMLPRRSAMRLRGLALENDLGM